MAQAEADPMSCLIPRQTHPHRPSHRREATLTNPQLLKGIGAPDKQMLVDGNRTGNIPATANGLDGLFLQRF